MRLNTVRKEPRLYSYLQGAAGRECDRCTQAASWTSESDVREKLSVEGKNKPTSPSIRAEGLQRVGSYISPDPLALKHTHILLTRVGEEPTGVAF